MKYQPDVANDLVRQLRNRLLRGMLGHDGDVHRRRRYSKCGFSCRDAVEPPPVAILRRERGVVDALRDSLGDDLAATGRSPQRGLKLIREFPNAPGSRADARARDSVLLAQRDYGPRTPG